MLLATLCVGLSAQVVSCSGNSDGGEGGTGGSSGPAVGGNSPGTGGNSPGLGGSSGSSSTKAGSGGKATTGGSSTAAAGGSSSAGSGTGGRTVAGGSSGTGGRTVTGGSSSTGGGSVGGTTSTGTNPSKTDPVPSKGCGKADGLKTLTTGGSPIANGLPTSTRLKITSGGKSREYIIDVPADYDPSHPYRLIFSWHQAYGSDTGNAVGQYPAGNGPNFNANNYAYFGLRREANNASQPSIFVAPGGISDFPWDFARDSVLFDELLALVGSNLCIDESRVFTTGFSFGAMMSYALSITRQTKLRAAVTMAAADYNLPGEPSDSNAAPIAYLGFTGMSDDRCPWINPQNPNQGGKACVLTHAKDNGCTIPGNIQTVAVGSKKYFCYDFEGCKAGYPVKVCTFDGAHTPSSIDDGTSTGDDGLKAFIPPLAWKFIAQF
jgi:poly(3-hydroxybutyrate) depolymerase